MIPSRHTDERFAIRSLIDNRQGGMSLVVSFFKGTIVTVDDIGRIYAGLEIDEARWEVVQQVLKERLVKD